MIARHWRGWTKPEDAEAYETLLHETVLPHIREVDGHRDAWVLRNDDGRETEFLVINFFESLDAVKRFAGTTTRSPLSNRKRPPFSLVSSLKRSITKCASRRRRGEKPYPSHTYQDIRCAVE